MKNRYKDQLGMFSKLWLVFFAVITIATTSCKDDDETSTPYVQFGVRFERNIEGNTVKIDSIVGEDYLFEAGAKETSQYFYLYSNIGDWILSVEEANQDWVVIWPAEGSNDGRFGVRLLKNDRGTTRKANLYVLGRDGQARGKLPIKQYGTDLYMNVEFNGTEKRVPYTGEEFTINVSANIAWFADNNGANWITIGETTDNSQKIIVDEHSGLGERTGEITFQMVGSTQKTTIKVIQSDKTTGYETATPIGIADLLAKLPGGEGTVSENHYIEAYVTNDITSRSIVSTHRDNLTWVQQTRLMTVQDDSRQGLLFEFNDEKDNTYKLHDKLKIHMYGANIAKDPTTGNIRVSTFSPINIKEQVPNTSGINPVELDNFDNLDQYGNTLVTIKEVEFAIPYGTYVNIDEGQLNVTASNWKATAEPYSDDTYEYGHILRDKKGNLVKLYTAADFTEKYVRLIPKGSGALTGIVMKRVKNDIESPILRIRNNNDNRVSDDPSTALSSEVMRIGPWETNTPISSVDALVGTGKLKQTSRAAQNVHNKGGTDYIYWAGSYMRMNAGEATAYQMLNNQTWWEANATLINDQPGEAWLITSSTAGLSGNGKLFLQFISSSSTSGPGIFTLEWAESETAPAADWKHIADYNVCDVNNSKQRMQYCFELPDEIKNKASVTLRLRVKENKRATMDESTIGASGSNCIGTIRITQLKN